MKHLQTFENFTASTPISKGAEIEIENEKRKAQDLENEKNLKELEEELEEETKRDKGKKKNKKEQN